MKTKVEITFTYEELQELYNEWTNRYDTCSETWAWYDVHERIWKKLRDGVDRINHESRQPKRPYLG